MWWILAALVGGAGAYWWRNRDQRRIVYPDAATLIIQPEDDGEERFLTLDGVINFRDVGGYRTGDGRTVKRGLIYRSAKLDGLTTAGQGALIERGVRLVCDLRSADEIASAPNNLPDGLLYQNWQIQTEDDRMSQLRTLLFDKAAMRDMVTAIYRHVMIDQNAAVFGAVIEHVADADNLPALIHCTAGKDRTGVAVALILSLLGVPEETIIADYTLSNRHYADYHAFAQRMIGRFAFIGIRADDVWPLLVCEAATLKGTLDHIRQHYGSIRDYVRDQAGVSDETVARLRENLLA